MTTNKKVAIVLACPDCRLWQECVQCLERIKAILKVDLVDPLLAPGMDGILAQGNWSLLKWLERLVVKVWFQKLQRLHKPVAVAVVGHCNCGGNPVTDEQHEADIRKGVDTVRSWGFQGPVTGILAERVSDDDWPLRVLTKEVQ